ncbi:MAG: methionine--tRNA ligase [Methanobacteriota archaeon]
MQKVLVAVAWPYANGPLHLGHIAGSLLPPDIFARYHRLRGNDVAMVSGSDMHGTPITVAAEKAGEPPEAFAEKNRRLHNEALRALSIHFDLFTSTATANHREVVHEIFLTLQRNGYIEIRTMTAPYDPKAARFLPDRYVEGECPHCHFGEARGDQCDECGRTLDPQELIRPRSKLTGAPPEYRETEHFFLRLDKLQDALSRWVAGQREKGHWRPSVVNFTEQWLKEGLKPRPITRDLTYGVPIPREAGEHPGKCIYVWFEAVIGYLSATIELSDSRARPQLWKEYWNDAAAKHYYFLGKDNIPFHTIIWPGVLAGYGERPGKLGRLTMPHDVPANEFLQFAGAKFSKSRGNAFYVLDLLQHFDEDQVRYYLAANMPEKGDTDWTWPDFVAKVNDELADTVGNYVNRVLTFLHSFRGGLAPTPDPRATAAMREKPGIRRDEEEIRRRLSSAATALEECRFKDALGAVMEIARIGNRAVNELAPWKAKTADDPRAAAIDAELLWHLGVVKSLAVGLQPFLPRLSDEIWRELGEPGPSPRAVAERSDGRDHWPAAVLSVVPGQRLGPVRPLVRKLDVQAVLDEFSPAAPLPASATARPPGGKPMVSLEEFQKIELRIAVVKSVDPHPKADKLYVVKVDIGGEERQLVAGLRPYLPPEKLLGKKVVVVANLAPATIRGVESQGMLLAAEADGTVTPLTPSEDIRAGATIR